MALRRRYGAFRYAWVREVGKERADCVCLKNERPIRLDEPRGDKLELLDCACGANGARLHLHLAIDVVPFIPKQWLQKNATACGFGWTDIRDARNLDKPVGWYLAKYLAKGWMAKYPLKTRRIQTSGVDKEPPEVGWAFTWYAIHLAVPMKFDGLYCAPGVAFWQDSG
jgi:hypothetical protein